MHGIPFNTLFSLQLARDGDAVTIKALLDEEKVGYIDETDFASMNTALHYACMNDHRPVVKLLVKNNADVNAYGDHGMSPMHFNARFVSSTYYNLRRKK